MIKPTSSSNPTSNKIVKNQLRPKQPVKPNVVKHFEPVRNKLPSQKQVTQGIPEIDANIDDKCATTSNFHKDKLTRSPGILQRCRINPNTGRKSGVAPTTPSGEAHDIRKSVTSAEEKRNSPFRRAPTGKLQSSSSSSMSSCHTPKKNTPSKSFHGRQNVTSNFRPIMQARNKTFILKSPQKNDSNKVQRTNFKSSTESSLLQRNPKVNKENDVKLQALKNEILSNKRTRKFDELTKIPDDIVSNEKYGELKNEIVKNRMDDVRRRKLWINELKSEIEQFKKLDTFEVYTLHQHIPSKRPGSEDEDSSSSGEIEHFDLNCDPRRCGNQKMKESYSSSSSECDDEECRCLGSCSEFLFPLSFVVPLFFSIFVAHYYVCMAQELKDRHMSWIRALRNYKEGF